VFEGVDLPFRGLDADSCCALFLDLLEPIYIWGGEGGHAKMHKTNKSGYMKWLEPYDFFRGGGGTVSTVFGLFGGGEIGGFVGNLKYFH